MTSSEVPARDRVTRVLIIVLLVVTAAAWAAMAWMTVLTYRGAPPLPGRIVSASWAPAAGRLRCRLCEGPQPRLARGRRGGELPDLLGAHHRRAQAGQRHVVDRQLAARAARREPPPGRRAHLVADRVGSIDPRHRHRAGIFRVYIDRPTPGEQISGVLGSYARLTPSQEALGKFFNLVALVLLVQIGAGAILGHYYAERQGFCGIPINDVLPFNFVRAVHVQVPIIWIGLGWIAAALFLAPHIGGGEPAGQRLLVNVFCVIVCAIVVGSVVGDYAGVKGWVNRSWFWVGNQGLEYLELGRLWQILFFIGLLGWSLIMLRTLWPTLAKLHRYFVSRAPALQASPVSRPR